MIKEADKKYIDENAYKCSLNEIWEYFNSIYTKVQIKNYCNRNNLEYRKLTSDERSVSCSNKKLTKQRQQTLVNHDYFKIWSNNMAYIFGLWCADGYISSKNNTYQFSIKLHKNDKYLLQQILNEMQSKHKIYENEDNSCLFVIGSKTIVNDIIKLGGKERKSLDLKFPKIPDEYSHDFIRGYFDGNGCISYNKANNKYVVSISGGSIYFLEGLLNTVRILDNSTKGGICKNNKNENSNTYKIWFGKKDTMKLGKIMYSEKCNLKLIRKYDKFQNI